METVGRSVRASIDFNGPLNALTTSPNNKLIAVGGRDVLKVVALEPVGFTERRNLRVGKSNLSFSTNDIRWHPQSDSLLATAATNGTVVIWNLQREGFKHVQERVLSGHRRAVNRICWHPIDGNILFSGSQDGSIKCWDKRGKVANTYQPKSESVRDVRVSSFQANKFAAAFENGIVQIWDMRKNTQPEIKFQAHKGLVLALDWHPVKANVLATGGRDRYAKIWDLGDVKQPKQTIQTIASVGRVAWRPNCPDHIATSASLMDNSIHVWDVQRPCIPLASMKGHSDVASGIEWLDTPTASSFAQGDASDWEGLDFWQHMLACSKDGTLKLHSLADSFKPHQSLPATALALNSRGQVAFSHDYVDRTCASLKIHRHLNITNALFTVTDVSTSSASAQKFANSPHGSFGMDLSEDPSRRVGQQPPLPPRASTQSQNGMTGSMGTGSASGGILRQGMGSQSSQNISAMGTGSATNTPADVGLMDSRRVIGHPSATSSAASSTTSSPVAGFFSSSSSPAPRALVALITMQNINKATELERIFEGDHDEFFRAQERFDAMQEQLPNGALLKDAFGFDEEVFRFLANHYVFVDEDMSFTEMCGHNALAAFLAGNPHLSQMWRIVEVLYGNEQRAEGSRPAANPASDGNSRSGPLDIRHLTGEDEDPTAFQADRPHGIQDHLDDPLQSSFAMSTTARKDFDIDELSSTTSSMMVTGIGGGTTHTRMLLQQLDHVNPQAMQGFDPYPYDSKGRMAPNGLDKENRGPSEFPGLRYRQNSKTSSMIVHGSAVHGELRQLRESVLKELLEYYVDLGDLQTSVAVSLVVSTVFNVENVMGKSWLQQIYMHYIDLLHQLRIYQAANELILNCPDQSIRQMNMRSTTMYSNCANCTKPFETTLNADGESVSSYLCSNCNNTATRCSVCQLPVRGLYVWCPVCSHGGHLEHLTEWFSEEEVCPTGCSHRCSLSWVAMNNAG
ncbi:hypothetical protein Poli38472_003950 [Pythium oligandrum]|uniref:WDR59/RTC1-like RING zinc finger domain-containing protein n=1 Tax=Pythium oligandrum TaxID=41045 RepID=A0A8K1CP53_PYTOL|nr:hypothetical protein Poli38472_003950 [Pythium oligandrum]|eukprot:TMW66185.1 hypothetical protein Poli38472_003950 [Pythium oligandrum]